MAAKKRRRFKFRQFIVISLIFVLILSVAYGYFIAPNNVYLNRIDFQSTAVSDTFNGFEITLLSDLNLTDSEDVEALETQVANINDQETQMVLFDGDLYEDAIFDEETVITILTSLKTSYGKFAVLGDKDIPNRSSIIALLNKAGFEVLQNEARKIYYLDDCFTLYGIDPSGNLEGLASQEDELSITLAHEPDSFATNQGQTDLQLSGHTNGGYIHIPLLRGLIKQANGELYTYGTYVEGASTLIISNGYDEESNFQFKYLCNNHIDIITLKHQNPAASTSEENTENAG